MAATAVICERSIFNAVRQESFRAENQDPISPLVWGEDDLSSPLVREVFFTVIFSVVTSLSQYWITREQSSLLLLLNIS
jgi:hypothetical protein